MSDIHRLYIFKLAFKAILNKLLIKKRIYKTEIGQRGQKGLIDWEVCDVVQPRARRGNRKVRKRNQWMELWLIVYELKTQWKKKPMRTEEATETGLIKKLNLNSEESEARWEEISEEVMEKLQMLSNLNSQERGWCDKKKSRMRKWDRNLTEEALTQAMIISLHISKLQQTTFIC